MNKDLDFKNYLYKTLPEFYKYEDREDRELERFLKIFGETSNFIYNSIYSYQFLFDVEKTPNELIPFLLEMVGLRYYSNIPMSYQRKFLNNVSVLKSSKGTSSALKYLARELSGKDAEVNTVEGHIEVNVLMRDGEYKTSITRRTMESYLKYFIPINTLLKVYLYFSSKPTNIYLTYKDYNFNVPYKICNRFITDEIKGGLLKQEVEIKEKIYSFNVLYPICNTFVTSTINIEKSESNVIFAKEYRDNEVLFKRAGSTFIGEGEI